MCATATMFLYLQFLYRVMSLKSKIMNIITAHPKLVTFGIGLAITFAIGTALGMVEPQQAQASVPAGALAGTVLHGAFS
jgi:hypothetical protein